MKKVVGIILIIPTILFLLLAVFIKMFNFYESFGLISLVLTIVAAMLLFGSFGLGLYLITNNDEDL